jgi:hypothetical protein
VPFDKLLIARRNNPEFSQAIKDHVRLDPKDVFERVQKGIRQPLAAYNVLGALSREP